MATKNIVPNDNGEGGIGVTAKRWSTAFINTVTGNVTGNLTGQVLTAAQTNINSILATDLIIGEDAQTAIDFGTVNEIDFKVDNANRLTLTSSVLAPATTNQIDLGTSSLEFKDAFFDGTVTADAFAGPLTGNVTGNASGTAATVTGAAQSNITSLGTLTALTISGDLAVSGGDITLGNGAATTIGPTDTGSGVHGSNLTISAGAAAGGADTNGGDLTLSSGGAGGTGSGGTSEMFFKTAIAADAQGVVSERMKFDTAGDCSITGKFIIADSSTIGCASDTDLLTLSANTLTLTHANSGIFFQSVGPVNSDSSTNNFRMATYNNAANNIIPTAKTGFTAAGNAVFLGDTGVDIIMGTSNSSGAPSNSFIGLEHGGNVTMNAGASTPDIPAFKLDDADDITLTRGSLIIGTAGKGIDFSAETPSGGGSGNTILDDYEEGTFTAAMSAGSGGTITLTAGGVDACTYTKIGRVINISGFFSVASVSSPSGRLKITGLPLTQVVDGVPIGVAYINASNSYTGFGIMLGDTGTGVFIDRNSVNGATAATDLASAMKAGTEVYFNLTYTTNT